MQGKKKQINSQMLTVSLFFKEQKTREVMVPASSAFSRSPPEDMIPIWELPDCETSSSRSLSNGTA